MEINVSELQVGDEFLFASNGRMGRAKVVRPIKIKKKQSGSLIQNIPYYSNVRCKVAIEEVSYTYTWNNKTRTIVKKKHGISGEFTEEKYINLNGNNLWLVKRDD